MKIKIRILLLSFVFLVGCEGQELYGNLSEHEANQIIALMASDNLKAEKHVNKEGIYSVTTRTGNFPAAMQLLYDHDLPRPEYMSMGEVFGDSSLVPSPTEERARLIYALSQEMANTLSNIDGVTVARVHLTLPEKNPLSSKVGTSSAAVFIKHREEVDLEDSKLDIKALVVNGVENMQLEDVTVVFSAERRHVYSVKGDDPDADLSQRNVVALSILKPQSLSAIGLIFVTIGMLVFGITYRQFKNKQLSIRVRR